MSNCDKQPADPLSRLQPNNKNNPMVCLTLPPPRNIGKLGTVAQLSSDTQISPLSLGVYWQVSYFSALGPELQKILEKILTLA